MNVLIVSFDKNLVKKLKDALKDYNVVDVKNGEEAINTVSSYIDVVIYDAVSGSISEEDINNMYKQKFKDSKYIILVDDLFPVDMNNIIPPKKVKLMREEAVERIKEVIAQETTEFTFTEPSIIEVFEGSPTATLPEPTPLPEEGSIILDKLPFETTMDIPSSVEKKKVMIVSFDSEIINRIKDALASYAEIIEAKNIKQAMERAKEADLIIFDTISGMLAYRTLMDMSKDEELKQKYYILLIDELFTIDVDSIPLSEKYAYAREAELGKAIQKVIELLEKEPQPTVAPIEEERESILDLFDEILGSQLEEVKKEEEVVEEQEQKSILPQEQEEVIAEKEERQEPIHIESVAENLAQAIKDIIKDNLSRDNLYSLLSQIVDYEDLKTYMARVVESKVEEVIRMYIEQQFSKIDMAQIVREEAYKVLKERLREIIT